jgi:hypothetical protein
MRDAAIKVVGIGSLGTSCWVALFMGREGDPLSLQVKERRLGAGAVRRRQRIPNHGQRVVNGSRLIQPASDIFLGWTQGGRDKRHYFIRQLRDIKINFAWKPSAPPR